MSGLRVKVGDNVHCDGRPVNERRGRVSGLFVFRSPSSCPPSNSIPFPGTFNTVSIPALSTASFRKIFSSLMVVSSITLFVEWCNSQRLGIFSFLFKGNIYSFCFSTALFVD
jgi:hypothetical protein